MGHLFNRNIIIAVSGGIAAYKSAELVRLLRKQGAEVRVIMTRGACEFITPLTLQALSGQPVYTELLDEEAEAGMGHIELARWADAMLVAPATADTLARLAEGRADDLLAAVALATPAPLFVAPAMNQQMWHNPATGANINQLKARHITVIGPDAGEQACGDIGPGRLLEPVAIVAAVSQHFERQLLAGKRVVITAGPTQEAIDPVRFLSNHSSGKMGFALARAASEAGAHTILVAGPVNLATPKGVERHNVTSALEMLAAAEAAAVGADVFIGAAAVADYRPATIAEQKIKKQGDDPLTLQLVQNPDIIAHIARSAVAPRLMVGFAAETEQLESHAASKRIRKGLDVIVANDVSRSDIGFNSEQNAVTLIDERGTQTMPIANKQQLAVWLIEAFAERLARKGDEPQQQGEHR